MFPFHGIKYSKKDVILIGVLGAGIIVSAIIVINYVEALFLVIMGWIILPIFFQYIYRKIKRFSSRFKELKDDE